MSLYIFIYICVSAMGLSLYIQHYPKPLSFQCVITYSWGAVSINVHVLIVIVFESD